MDVHKNARSCPASRALLVRRVCEQGWSVREGAAAIGISERRGREWIRRASAGETLTDGSTSGKDQPGRTSCRPNGAGAQSRGLFACPPAERHGRRRD